MAAPFRSCDHCDKPAVVHNTVIVNGVLHEMHLCEKHAAARGISVPGSPTLTAILGDLTVTATAGAAGAAGAAIAGASAAKPRGPVCERCGMTFAEHRQKGVLGCSDCYQAFQSTLNVVLERAHGGTVQHVGKAPNRVGDSQQRAAVIAKMLRELEEAVRAEQYERAAKLRDQIKTMRPAGSPQSIEG